MAEGEKISISGFGTFEVRERAERQGINPRTREPITIAASQQHRVQAGQGSEGHPVSTAFCRRGRPPMVPAVFVVEPSQSSLCDASHSPFALSCHLPRPGSLS